MKIGITTIHHVNNYGAVWQAYALSRFVTNLGHDVEVIDFRPQVAVDFYRQPLIKNRRPNLKRAILSMVFQNFIRKRLPLGPSLCTTTAQLTAAANRYDALIAGSDQIWCTGEGSFRGYEPNFFLDFCQNPKVRKISYAASAGNTKDFAEHTSTIAKSLAAFSSISVRDESTSALVKKASGLDATLVLDPTFLHDFQEIVGNTSLGNDLVIFAENPERFASIASSIAQKHGCRIVAIGKPCSVAHANHQIVSPIAWLRYIKGAKAVLTDFFHGTALSLHFGRPILVSAPSYKTKKITDLLKRVNLQHLFIDDISDGVSVIELALKDPKLHTEMTQERLSTHRKHSKEFLKTALA